MPRVPCPHRCSTTSSPTPSARCARRSRRAFLERQAFEEHFQVDVLLGDLTWETSYGLPGEGQPPRVVAHITFDWPTWSQTVLPPLVRRRGVRRGRRPSRWRSCFRVQRLAEQPDPAAFLAVLPDAEPADRQRDASSGPAPTVEIAYDDDPTRRAEYAIEITYEGLYELAEETLADGSSKLLDEHFGALGGWIASMLVRLGDLSSTSCRPTTTTEPDRDPDASRAAE